MYRYYIFSYEASPTPESHQIYLTQGDGGWSNHPQELGERECQTIRVAVQPPGENLFPQPDLIGQLVTAVAEISAFAVCPYSLSFEGDLAPWRILVCSMTSYPDYR